MIDHSHPLPDGTRLRVRLPQARDRAGLHALHARVGVAAEDLDVLRLMRFDPRGSTVLVATAFVDGRERVVAYARGPVKAETPDLLLCDPGFAPHAADALTGVVAARAAGRSAA